MKICKKCGEEKPVREFYCDHTSRKSTCNKCLKETGKKRREKYIEEGRCVECGKLTGTPLRRCKSCLQKKADRDKANRQRLRVRAIEYMGDLCEICGHHYDCFDIYDFHHMGCGEKKFEIGDRIGRGHIGWEQLREELDKCLILCANCHRWVHSREKAV